MGLFGRRREKEAIASATERATAWIERLQSEMTADVADPYVRRLFKASAVGAAGAVEGGILQTNSFFRLVDGADEASTREEVVRRAQWTIALATLRCMVPDDEEKLQAKIAAVLFESVDKGTPRGDAAWKFWREEVRLGACPGPGGLMDILSDQMWFKNMAFWVVGPLRIRDAEVPPGLALTQAVLHLQSGCSETFRIYAGE